MKTMFLVIIMLATQSLWAATSQENRSDLKFSATYQLGYDYLAATQQLGLSVFVKPDHILTLKLGTDSSEDRTQTDFALQYKVFTGNSFYFAPEAYYVNYFGKHDSAFEGSSGNITTLGLGVRIGNQWQWDNFTLGCDWFGLGKNLAYWNKTDDFLTSHILTVTLLNFYLGISF